MPRFWARRSYLPKLQPLLLWQSLSLFWLCGILAPSWPLPILGAAIVFWIIDNRLRSLKNSSFAILLFFIGLNVFFLSLNPRPPYPDWALDPNTHTAQILPLTGRINKVQSLSDGRLRIFLQEVHVQNHAEKSLRGTMIWTWQQQEKHKNFRPLPGQYVNIQAKINTTHGFQNQGLSDYGFYWQSQGVFWRIWSRGDYGNPHFFGQAHAFAQVRERARLAFYKSIAPLTLDADPTRLQALAFLPALLFGEKYDLSPHTFELMASASLVHSLALSGQHLALVGVLMLLLGLAIRFLQPQIFLYIPRQSLLGILSLPLALLYLWLGNAPPSLIRACIMLLLGVIIYVRHKPNTLVDVLLLTVLLISFVSPLSLYQVGLQLSVLCVASIALVLPLLRRIPKPYSFMVRHKPLRYFLAIFARNLAQILLISLSIQVVLLPIFLLYFPPAGPWFILNIMWLPILSLWVLPLMALGFMSSLLASIEFLSFFIPISTFLLHMASWPCELLLHLLHTMESQGLFNFPALLRPNGTSILAWIALSLGLGLMAGRMKKFPNSLLQKKILTLLILSTILLFAEPVWRSIKHWQNNIYLDMIDVGQGQAIALTFKGGIRVLIDGGGVVSKHFDTGADIVVPSLSHTQAPRLYAVINSHPDTDHARGLMAVLQKMSVTHFYKNHAPFRKHEAQFLKNLSYTKTYALPQVLYAGDRIALPSQGDKKLYFQVLHAPKEPILHGNNASLVLRLVAETAGKTHGLALICGDIEQEGLLRLLKSKQDLSAEVLILPHHGAASSHVPALYTAVNPSMALASAGKNNSFGFPSHAVRQSLAQKNIPLYSTAEHGHIRLTWHEITFANKGKKQKILPQISLPKIFQ